MTSTMTKDMEALIDLFLSPTFHPFESERSPFESETFIAAGPAAKPEVICFHDVPEGETDDDDDDELEYEAAGESDAEDEANEEAVEHVQPVIQCEQTVKHCGQILARMGDEFFNSYPQTRGSGATSAVPLWKSVGEQLKSVFMKVAQLNDTDPDAEQKKQEAWQDFKAILNNAVSDNDVGNAFKILGALLLSLHGLSAMMSGVKGLARSYFIRYIRERELDVEMQRLGGLNRIMNQELD